MTADVSLLDLAMAALLCSCVFLIAAGVIWAVLRHANKVGPLARAQQQHEIDEFQVNSVLRAKQAEAKILLAEAEIVAAQAKVYESQQKMLGGGDAA